MANNITAICRVCNKSAPADQFKLHYKLKQMVCPNCFSGKTEKAAENAEQKKVEEPPRPAGWDKEDEYLEKMARLRPKEQNPQFTKIPGSTLVKCTCSICEYTFKYDPLRKIPYTCPYCNGDIPKLKTFNLL